MVGGAATCLGLVQHEQQKMNGADIGGSADDCLKLLHMLIADERTCTAATLQAMGTCWDRQKYC